MAQFAEIEQLSGLAGDIRSSVSSEQYDLGGYTEIRARELIITAFSKPLSAPTEMIKFTFVVGGGKLVRSRYPEDLSKWMIAALREISFVEDRSAAETFDSQGSYKQQHDTGQNLKYLIVYPKVTCASEAQGKPSGAENAVLLDTNSPAYIVSMASMSTFQEIVASKIISYAQKKAALKILQDKAEEFKAVEAKLVTGAMLTPYEQQVPPSTPTFTSLAFEPLANMTH
jgi:hypothetical protein